MRKISATYTSGNEISGPPLPPLFNTVEENRPKKKRKFSRGPLIFDAISKKTQRPMGCIQNLMAL